MIKNFIIWLNKNTECLGNKGIKTIEIVESTHMSNNPSIRVDSITEAYFGRITLWESGDTDIEILDSATGDTVLYEHFIVDETNFDIYINKYFDFM